MSNTSELNRMELNILKFLHDGAHTDQYHSIIITEPLRSYDELLRIRMTVHKKLRKLINAGYIKKGIIDIHADSFYLTAKGLKLFDIKDLIVPLGQLEMNGTEKKI